MKKKKHIFLSWSGKKSKKYAQVICEMLKEVFGGRIKVFNSGNINYGETWFTEIKKSLRNADLGILVLTEENIHSHWVLFEGGALFSRTNLIPVMIGRDIGKVESPLKQLQFAENLTKESLQKILRIVKEKFDLPIEDALLNSYIDANWESGKKYKKKFKSDNRFKSPGTQLTIDNLKESANYFLEKHSSIIKEVDLIVGLNYAGATMTPILANGCNKDTAYIWLRQSYGKIETWDEDDEKNKIEIHVDRCAIPIKLNTRSGNKQECKEFEDECKILIVDGKYKSGESVKTAIEKLGEIYDKNCKFYLFVSLYYGRKKMKVKDDKIEKSFYYKWTHSIKGSEDDPIKEELNPYTN